MKRFASGSLFTNNSNDAPALIINFAIMDPTVLQVDNVERSTGSLVITEAMEP